MRIERLDPGTGKTEAIAAELIRDAVACVQPDDFQFSVDARGATWDVYKIHILGDVALVALRLDKGQVEIAYCSFGLDHSVKEIVDALNNQDN